MSKPKKFPECEKLNKVANVQATLIDFTDWLTRHGYSIRVFEDNSEADSLQLVHQFMGINPTKLEKERRSMLE